MDLRTTFYQEPELVEKGVWFNLQDQGRVKVASMNSPLFKAEVIRLQKPHLNLLRSDADSSDLLNSITIEATAKTLLLDWKEIEVDGKEIEYSVEKAIELLTDFPMFREKISALSSTDSNYFAGVVKK